MRKFYVECSKRGFANEIMVYCFDTKQEAEEFLSNHEYYAKLVSKKEALKNNSFGYYICNGSKRWD